MSIFQKNFILDSFKSLLKGTLYRSGTVALIFWGPLRGYKYVVNDNSGWASIYGGWEPGAQQVYRKLIKPGHVVYDLGANTGIHSLLFSVLTGSTGNVYAFEPLPENIKEIENLIILNQVHNLHIVKQGVSNHSGSMTFKIGKNNKQGSLVGIGCETGNEVTISVSTLDALIANGLEAADFIKMDIEGAESDALEGFSNSIALTYPTFAIDLHTPEQDLKVAQFFKGHGYTLYRLNSSLAKQLNHQRHLLMKITNLDAGWGTADGVWGTIIAIHPSRSILP